MKNTLMIFFIVAPPTIAQAEKMLDKQAEVVNVSEQESAKKVQNSHALLQTLNTHTESFLSKTKTDSSTHIK